MRLDSSDPEERAIPGALVGRLVMYGGSIILLLAILANATHAPRLLRSSLLTFACCTIAWTAIMQFVNRGSAPPDARTDKALSRAYVAIVVPLTAAVFWFTFF